MILKPVRRNGIKSIFETEPSLYSIWLPDLSKMAAIATREYEVNDYESGVIYTAYINDVVLVGITGWYEMSKSEVGLRWHGILPGLRGRGYSKLIIDLVCSSLPVEVKKVYEVTRNPVSMESFCKCGFSVITDIDSINKAIEFAGYGTNNDSWVLCKNIN